ncbi:MAG: copper homeostasis membrane protein CopD [Hyphomicrobiales bacterium]
MPEIDVPLILARWLHFASLMIVFGASLFHLCALPTRLRDVSLRAPAATHRIVGAAGYLALGSGLGWAARSLVVMAGGLSSLFDWDTLAGFFIGTSFGPIWLVRIALLVLILLAAAMPMDKAGKVRHALLACLAGGALSSQAWLGHAAMASGARLALELASYITHVLAAGAWIGGLVPLAELLAGRGLGRDGSGISGYRAILLRFSNLGMNLVLLILATGLANGAFRLRSAHDLLAADYGYAILAKGLLFSLMLIVAAVNRWRLMPRIEGETEPALDDLRRNILVELALAVLVLGVAAILGTLPPRA